MWAGPGVEVARAVSGSRCTQIALLLLGGAGDGPHEAEQLSGNCCSRHTTPFAAHDETHVRLVQPVLRPP